MIDRMGWEGSEDRYQCYLHWEHPWRFSGARLKSIHKGCRPIRVRGKVRREDDALDLGVHGYDQGPYSLLVTHYSIYPWTISLKCLGCNSFHSFSLAFCHVYQDRVLEIHRHKLSNTGHGLGVYHCDINVYILKIIMPDTVKIIWRVRRPGVLAHYTLTLQQGGRIHNYLKKIGF